MTFIQGSLTSATPAKALYDLIATALVSEGYDLVDTVAIGARTHKVWRSPAVGNSESLDWYLDYSYTTTNAGALLFSVFEDYDAVSHLGFRGIMDNLAAGIYTQETTYYTRYGATGKTLESDFVKPTSIYVSQTIATVTSGLGYWISVTPDRVLALTSVEDTRVYIAGFYEAVEPYRNAQEATGHFFPLCAGAYGMGENLTYLSLTRLPKYMGQVTRIPHLQAQGALGVFARSGDLSGVWSSWAYPAIEPSGSKIPASATPTSPSGASSRELAAGENALIAYLPDLLLFQASASVVRGDSITVGDVQYVLSSRLNNFVIAFPAV